MENTNFPSLHSLLLLLGTPPLPAVQVGVKEISRCLICACLQVSNTCLLVVQMALAITGMKFALKIKNCNSQSPFIDELVADFMTFVRG